LILHDFAVLKKNLTGFI